MARPSSSLTGMSLRTWSSTAIPALPVLEHRQSRNQQVADARVAGASANLGNAAHRVLFGGRIIETIEGEDWRIAAAREDRDKARANGDASPALFGVPASCIALRRHSRLPPHNFPTRIRGLGSGSSTTGILAGSSCRTSKRAPASFPVFSRLLGKDQIIGKRGLTPKSPYNSLRSVEKAGGSYAYSAGIAGRYRRRHRQLP
jgi:hypothetical protein